MFYVSTFSKEAAFKISNYEFALDGSKQINIYSHDIEAASILYKRIQKADTKQALKISINSPTFSNVAFIIGEYDTKLIDACYIFNFTRNDAIGIIPPIEKLEETNWLMFKYLIDSMESRGLLNSDALALKAKRDIYREQIDEYNSRTIMDASHEPPTTDITDGAVHTLLEENLLNKVIK